MKQVISIPKRPFEQDFAKQGIFRKRKRDRDRETERDRATERDRERQRQRDRERGRKSYLISKGEKFWKECINLSWRN